MLRSLHIPRCRSTKLPQLASGGDRLRGGGAVGGQRRLREAARPQHDPHGQVGAPGVHRAGVPSNAQQGVDTHVDIVLWCLTTVLRSLARQLPW